MPSPTGILYLVLLLPSSFIFRHFYLSQMTTCHEVLRKKACVLFIPFFYVVMQINRIISNSKFVFFYCSVSFGNSKMDAVVSPLD